MHAGIRAAADRYSDWEELGKHELGLAVLASCTAPGDGSGQLHCEKSVREMSLDKENLVAALSSTRRGRCPTSRRKSWFPIIGCVWKFGL